jgi:predicted transcriptional regulator
MVKALNVEVATIEIILAALEQEGFIRHVGRRCQIM